VIHFRNADAGQFCWLDLAATDASSAKTFYRNLFGWTSHEQLANDGSFTRLRLSDHDVDALPQSLLARRRRVEPTERRVE